MNKLSTYGLVVIDLLAFLAATSFASCFSSDTQTCQKSITSPVTWFLIVLALISTGFYLYKRHQKGLPLLPFNFLAKPNVSWIYGVYYFFALIFWGENVPEIAGYLKGLPLGEPGTHASLMNPALFFQGNSGTTINLITFGMMSFAVAFFFRKLNFLAAIAGTVTMGTLIEYVTKLGKPQGGPEGFDIYNNFWGTILNFMWLWTLLAIVPFVIFALVNRAWKMKGVVVLIVLMVILNIASYFYFRYEIYVLKNVKPGFLGSGSEILEILPPKTCPDQLVTDNGKLFAYRDGKGFFIKDQAGVDWINQNCPSTQKDSSPTVTPSPNPAVSLNVLGVPCQSGGLSTSTNKVFQMTYPNETFLQLVNTGLLKDISQLKDLTCLQYLDATDKNLKGDIANLKNLTELEVLSLYSNPEVSGDICVLAGTTKLRSLKFAFDPKITGDVSCLKNLTKLEAFAASSTAVSGDIAVFANMPNLKALYINGTKIKGNICSLSKLTNLEELGVADEYPGNPDITGDLSCLNNLQKLKRVSIYGTGTINCEQFTKSHPDLANTKTDSGKQGGGGCSKESLKTLVNYNQQYEKKIGKEVQTEVAGKPNFREESFRGNSPGSEEKQDFKQPNVFQRLMIWVFSIFGKTPPGAPGPDFQSSPKEPQNNRDGEDPNEIRSQAGPGGCKTAAECDKYCNNPDNQEECSKFAPPGKKR